LGQVQLVEKKEVEECSFYYPLQLIVEHGDGKTDLNEVGKELLNQYLGFCNKTTIQTTTPTMTTTTTSTTTTSITTTSPSASFAGANSVATILDQEIEKLK
jgi:hypothetical protein